MIHLYGETGFELFNPTMSSEEEETLLFNAARILQTRGYPSAASLLKRFPFRLFSATNWANDDFNVLYAEVPLDQYEELRQISQDDEGKYAFHVIASVITEIGPYVRVVACELDQEQPTQTWRIKANLDHPVDKGAAQQDVDDLIRDIIAQRDLMIDVATGRATIQDVSSQYEDRRMRIATQIELCGIEDPNPFSTLWKWYERWKSGDLLTYQSRRGFVSDLYEPLIDKLRRVSALSSHLEPTGWVRVDRGLYAVRRSLSTAQSEEDFQTVGLLCREVIISLAQAVYDPKVHTPIAAEKLSDTDAYRMLEAFISHELIGSTNEAARRFTKASLVLANELQHKRTANFRDAALCAEAISNVVNSIAIVSGRRSQSA